MSLLISMPFLLLYLHSSNGKPIQHVGSHLTRAVPSVNQDIRARSVAAGIADQVHIGTLELFCVAIASHGDHALPQVLHLLVNEIAQSGVNVPRGNAVYAGKVTPLVGQTASHVDAAGFGHVVTRLLLRKVGNVARHGGRDDKAAVALFLEVRTNGLGAVEGAVQISLNDFFPRLDAAFENAAIGCAPRIGNEGVHLAKLGNDILDQLIHRLKGRNVTLVGLDFDAVFLPQFFGVLVAAIGS